MFLYVQPNGGKWWRIKYRYGGKEKQLSLGTYPRITLKQARKRREEIKQQLEEGLDPSFIRKAPGVVQADSFEAVAREWFNKQLSTWSENHSIKIIRRLERDVFPWIGGMPIGSIEPPTVLQTLRRIESRGAIETAHRAMQNCSQIFRYAVATGRATRDPIPDLKGALTPSRPEHYATITDPGAIGHLLRAMDGYRGSLITRCALNLAPLVFVRPGELRHAEWAEIDLDTAEWRIPANKMKSRAPHIVPLSRQAIEVLVEIQPSSLFSRYVFPGRTSERPMSENTINAALRGLGYEKGMFTGHGFRSMASTLLNEQGWNRDAIERQLAHAERDSVRAAYNYAEHLPLRREMMQAWADYLDSLKNGAEVIPLRVGA